MDSSRPPRFPRRRRTCSPWARRVRARLHWRRPISQAGWPATWWPLGTEIFRPTSSAKASIASSTRLARWSRARVSSPARWRSGSSEARAASPEARVLTTNIRTIGDQRCAGQRDVRPCGRDRRFRAGHQGASRLCGRARRAGDGRARRTVGHRAAQRGRARLRPLLPFPHGARPGPRAGDAPQRRGHELHVRAASRPRRRSPGSTKRGCAYALSYAAQQVSGLWSWVARRRAHREGVRLRRHGRPQRRHGRRHGADHGFTGVRDVLDGEHNMFEALSSRTAAGGNGRRPGQPVLVDGDRDQDLLSGLSDSGRRSTLARRCVASTG